MEYFGVYDKETVMGLLVGPDGYRRIFGIVPLQVQLQLFVEFGGIYRGFYSFLPFAEHHERTFIYVIVDENDGFFGGFYQVGGKDVGIEDLSFEEDTFYRGQGGADEEVNLFFCLCDTFFQSFHALVDGVAFEEVFFKDLV